MNAETVQALLAKQPFVRGFKPEQMEKLGRIATLVEFPTDHVLFREGDECQDFYLIVSGMVALEIQSGGQDWRLETLSSGDELGWSSVLMGQTRAFQARTLEKVKAIAFVGSELRGMCEADTAFGYELMLRLINVVAERLQFMRLQVLDQYWTPAKRAGA